jgi:hypothetical protein
MSDARSTLRELKEIASRIPDRREIWIDGRQEIDLLLQLAESDLVEQGFSHLVAKHIVSSLSIRDFGPLGAALGGKTLRSKLRANPEWTGPTCKVFGESQECCERLRGDLMRKFPHLDVAAVEKVPDSSTAYQFSLRCTSQPEQEQIDRELRGFDYIILTNGVFPG